MREWLLRAMAAALILPLAACVEAPPASAPPGYAIGVDGRAYLAPPPRSSHVYGGPVYVPPVVGPRTLYPRSVYPPAYYPPGYYPRSYDPPAYYPPAFYAPSRRPSFWGPGRSDRHYRDREDHPKKGKKPREKPDREPGAKPGVKSGAKPGAKPVVKPGPDRPGPDRPKPEREKPPKRKLLIEPRSGSGAAESRGDG